MLSRKQAKLLNDLLDHGWEVKEFNSKEITLRPKSTQPKEVKK